MVQFQGRVITDPDRFRMGRFKRGHIEQVRTPAGTDRVLNINKANKQAAIDQKLQQAGQRNIYLKVDQRQVIAFRLDGATDRQAFTDALRQAIDGPDHNHDLKFKSSLIGVYRTLMQTGQLAIPNPGELDNAEQELVQKLQERLPNSAHLTQLRQLMPEYTSPVEQLDRRLDHVWRNQAQIENSPEFLAYGHQAAAALPHGTADEIRTETWNRYIYSEFYTAVQQPHPLADASDQGASDYMGAIAQVAQARPAHVPAEYSFLQYSDDGTGNPYSIADFDQHRQAGTLPPGHFDSAKTDFFYFQSNTPSLGHDPQRVYINARGDEAAALMGHLVGLMDGVGGQDGTDISGIKVNGPAGAGGRADTIVVYTDSRAASERVVALLRTQDPNIFGTNPPEMTENVFPGVALADEVPLAHQGVESFGSLRSKAIAEALTANPPPASRAAFQEAVEARLDHYGIKPLRVERNQ